MIPKTQTRLHRGNKPEERGNCFPSVIASILEMEVEDVIQVQEHYDDGDWMTKLENWLNERELQYCSADYFKCFHPNLRNKTSWILKENETLDEHINRLCQEHKDKYYFVIGKSPRNKDINHIVIFQNGIMVHDPHPDRTGLLTHETFTVIQ